MHVHFQKYKVLVKAETETATTSALSDGVIVIDDKANLNDILVFDGESCPGDTDIGTVVSSKPFPLDCGKPHLYQSNKYIAFVLAMESTI